MSEIGHPSDTQEWLPSLPKHVSLYRAFGWDFPHFAHLPLMVNSKGMKLSKRKDDVAIDSYRVSRIVTHIPQLIPGKRIRTRGSPQLPRSARMGPLCRSGEDAWRHVAVS